MINISEIVNSGILEDNKEREGQHISSGKLSASMLGQPIQWQILKYLGVPKRENDAFELAKFQRGRDVEDFIVKMLLKRYPEGQQQVECKYRDCIGYLDFKAGNEAIEVKSTGALAYKHILKEGQAKKGHALQAAFYGVALELETFSVCYVNSDTYQTILFEYKTKKFKAEIDAIIDKFEAAIAAKTIPSFFALEKWQSLPQYQPYQGFAEMSKQDLVKESEKLYSGKLGSK